MKNEASKIPCQEVRLEGSRVHATLRLREKFDIPSLTQQYEARLEQLRQAQDEVLNSGDLFGSERTKRLLQDIRRERAELEAKL